MFTGPVGPVEVFFYWPEDVFGNFYWPGAIGLPLASSPGHDTKCRYQMGKSISSDTTWTMLTLEDTLLIEAFEKATNNKIHLR